jgi:pimeloyl-CoA synthetase
MAIRFHPHALERIAQRGASKQEVIVTVETGERFDAKFNRTGFRRNFAFDKQWRGKHYETKQVEAYAVQENDDWLVISVITRYF